MTAGNDKRTSASAETIDTVVIGGSQAGLAVSYHLTRSGRPQIVLERDRIGARWIADRWESFTLVTPNWMNRLPGFPYSGPDPDGFLSRDDVVAYLEAYAASFGAPVRLGVQVERLASRPDGPGYWLETSHGPLAAKNVVVATGFFHKPCVPPFAGRISPSVDQLSSAAYKSPSQLRLGAVMVVGSGQSGCQIAEELHEAGRRVYLCVGRAPREPRRYRGKDINFWFDRMGLFDRPLKNPAKPVERYRANPHCSGKNGGHALNLGDFAAAGMTLLGRLADADGDRLALAPDLAENMARADNASLDLMSSVDDYIASAGVWAPPPDRENTDDGRSAGRPRLDNVTALDLREHGITTIIWATGFTCDFGWIDVPVFDGRGYPIQDRGVSLFPGLYFCGLHWMHTLKSGLLYGVGEAAQHVAGHLLSRTVGIDCAAA